MLLVLFGVAVTTSKNGKNIITNDAYTSIVSRINNKETLNLVILSDEEAQKKEIFKYYEDMYNLKFEYLKPDNSDSYKKLMDVLGYDIKPEEDMVFVVIKEGKPSGCIFGYFEESGLKRALIEYKLIDEKYTDIDTIMREDLSLYQNDKVYNILYINGNDKELNEYRKKLVNNEITSLILYSNNLDQKDIATNMNKKLNLGKRINDKLPILIKYRNGEILESIPNITSENLVAECNK